MSVYVNKDTHMQAIEQANKKNNSYRTEIS